MSRSGGRALAGVTGCSSHSSVGIVDSNCAIFASSSFISAISGIPHSIALREPEHGGGGGNESNGGGDGGSDGGDGGCGAGGGDGGGDDGGGDDGDGGNSGFHSTNIKMFLLSK